MKVCSLERYIEIKRQMLCDKNDFEPYVAFQRLSRNGQKGISSANIMQFLSENLVDLSLSKCRNIINHYDSDLDGVLSYKEFLEMVLPKEHPDLRAFVTQRQCFDIQQEEYLSYETEAAMAVLLNLEIDLFEDAGIQKSEMDKLALSGHKVVELIDGDPEGNLNYTNIQKYLNNSGLMAYESEIINFLRRVDRDDDGVITGNELMNFLQKFDRPQRTPESKRDYTIELNHTKLQCLSPGRKIVTNTVSMILPENADPSQLGGGAAASLHPMAQNGGVGAKGGYRAYIDKNPQTRRFVATDKENSDKMNTSVMHQKHQSRRYPHQELQRTHMNMTPKQTAKNLIHSYHHQAHQGQAHQHVQHAREHVQVDEHRPEPQDGAGKEKHSEIATHQQGHNVVVQESKDGSQNMERRGGGYSKVSKLANNRQSKTVVEYKKYGKSAAERAVNTSIISTSTQKTKYDTFGQGRALLGFSRTNKNAPGQVLQDISIGSAAGQGQPSQPQQGQNGHQSRQPEQLKQRGSTLNRGSVGSGVGSQSRYELKKAKERVSPGYVITRSGVHPRKPGTSQKKNNSAQGNQREPVEPKTSEGAPKTSLVRQPQPQKDYLQQAITSGPYGDKIGQRAPSQERSRSPVGGGEPGQPHAHNHRQAYEDDNSVDNRSQLALNRSRERLRRSKHTGSVKSNSRSYKMPAEDSRNISRQQDNTPITPNTRVPVYQTSVKGRTASRTKMGANGGNNGSNAGTNPQTPIQNYQQGPGPTPHHNRHQIKSQTSQYMATMSTKHGGGAEHRRIRRDTLNSNINSNNHLAQPSQISHIMDNSVDNNPPTNFNQSQMSLRTKKSNRSKSKKRRKKKRSPSRKKRKKSRNKHSPRSRAKSKKRRVNKVFFRSLYELIMDERGLEESRRMLTSREDFSAKEMFKMVDKNGTGRFSFEDFRMFLIEIGVQHTDRQSIVDLYSCLNSNQNCLLSYDDLALMICPRDKSYASLIHKHHPGRPYKGLSDETTHLLAECFNKLFASRKLLIQAKQSFKDEQIEFHDAFEEIGESAKGYLIHDDFVNYIRKRKPDYAESDFGEIGLFMENCDLDRDGKITFKDFYMFFSS